jgi:hypothetical protein
MMLGLLHFIPDADDPYELTGATMAAVPSGSYLAISHASSDLKTGPAGRGPQLQHALRHCNREETRAGHTLIHDRKAEPGEGWSSDGERLR